jgi:hypothetical protein
VYKYRHTNTTGSSSAQADSELKQHLKEIQSFRSAESAERFITLVQDSAKFAVSDTPMKTDRTRQISEQLDEKCKEVANDKLKGVTNCIRGVRNHRRFDPYLKDLMVIINDYTNATASLGSLDCPVSQASVQIAINAAFDQRITALTNTQHRMLTDSAKRRREMCDLLLLAERWGKVCKPFGLETDAKQNVVAALISFPAEPLGIFWKNMLFFFLGVILGAVVLGTVAYFIRLRPLQKEKVLLTNGVTQLKIRSHEFEQEVKTLNENLRTKTIEADLIKQNAEIHRSNYESSYRELKELQKEYQMLARLRGGEGNAANLLQQQEKLAQLESQLNQLNADVKARDTRITNLQSDLSKWRMDASEYERCYHQSKNDLIDIQQEFKSVQTARTTDGRVIADLKAQVDATEKQAQEKQIRMQHQLQVQHETEVQEMQTRHMQELALLKAEGENIRSCAEEKLRMMWPQAFVQGDAGYLRGAIMDGVTGNPPNGEAAALFGAIHELCAGVDGERTRDMAFDVSRRFYSWAHKAEDGQRLIWAVKMADWLSAHVSQFGVRARVVEAGEMYSPNLHAAMGPLNEQRVNKVWSVALIKNDGSVYKKAIVS